MSGKFNTKQKYRRRSLKPGKIPSGGIAYKLPFDLGDALFPEPKKQKKKFYQL
jgi:hypothetical protein